LFSHVGVGFPAKGFGVLQAFVSEINLRASAPFRGWALGTAFVGHQLHGWFPPSIFDNASRGASWPEGSTGR